LKHVTLPNDGLTRWDDDLVVPENACDQEIALQFGFNLLQRFVLEDGVVTDVEFPHLDIGLFKPEHIAVGPFFHCAGDDFCRFNFRVDKIIDAEKGRLHQPGVGVIEVADPGDFIIKEKDILIVICTLKSLAKTEDLFTGNP